MGGISGAVTVPLCDNETDLFVPIEVESTEFISDTAINHPKDFSPNDDESTHRRNHLDFSLSPVSQVIPTYFIKQFFSSSKAITLDLFRYYICTNAP